MKLTSLLLPAFPPIQTLQAELKGGGGREQMHKGQNSATNQK